MVTFAEMVSGKNNSDKFRIQDMGNRIRNRSKRKETSGSSSIWPSTSLFRFLFDTKEYNTF